LEEAKLIKMRVSTKEFKRNGSRFAYEKIKKKILQNELDSEEKLVEDNLSRELNLSRTPIREALIMLQKEGLLARFRGRGFFIQRFSIKDVYDFYEFRNILETASIDLVVSNVTDENINELYKVLEKAKKFIQKGKSTRALVEGLQFHIKFIEICNNDMIINSLTNCYDKLILISWSSHQIEACSQSVKEHEKILSALEEKNSDQLRKYIHQHIINARERTLNIFRDDTQRLYYMP
jgi:DNA-binding GntR family transcriptional regulator